MKFTLILLTVCACAPAFAQSQPPATTGGLPLWEAGLVGGWAQTPAYPAANETVSRALVLPFVVYRGDVFRIDRGGIDARLRKDETTELDIGFSASLPSSSNDVAVRKGMRDLGTLFEFGPRVKWTLARPVAGMRIKAELPLRAVIEVNGGLRGQGAVLEPEIAVEGRDAASGLSGAVKLALVLGDSQINRYFYGVEAADVTAKRPLYSAQAGLIATRLTLSTGIEITKDLRAYGFARYESFGGAANQSSPLFARTDGTAIGVGLSWTLARSDARGSN